jgi:signal transduction histidine kinase
VRNRPPRSIRALLILAPALVVVSAVFEFTSVARIATERAVTESAMITSAVRRQLDLVANASPGAGLEAAADDPGLQLVLADALADAKSVLHVAVCDTNRVAVAHSLPTLAGRVVERRPHLPRIKNLGESFPELWRLQPHGHFETSTPLSRDGEPFASIVVVVTGTFLWDSVQEAFWRGVVVSLVVLSVVIGVVIVLSRVVVGRVRTLEAGVVAFREGRFDDPIPESGADEFSRLAHELNLLGEQFRREQRRGARRPGRAEDFLGEGILALGAEDEVILVNRPAAELLGLERDGAVGRRLGELVTTDHPVRALCEKLRTSSERSLSVPLPPNGRSDMVAVGHRIEEPDEPDPSILIEIKSAKDQAALHNLVDQTRVLMHLGQMAAGVAHEIRNPLQALTLELDALSEVAGDEPGVEKHVRGALQKVRRLDLAIRGFLKIARLRPRLVERIELNGLLDEIRSELETDAILAGLELEMDPCPEPATVDGDREVLRQAISNLVQNAIEAQPSADGRIVIGCRPASEGVRVSVTDTGPGIPPEDRQKVLELFYTTREEGTGVGLAIVRQTAEMYGGSVEIDAGPGGGTAVTLTLP